MDDASSSSATTRPSFVALSRHKSREERKSDSDSDNEDIIDGEKIKNKLLSAWNNVKYGFTVPVMKANFSEDSPIWLLGRCYHSKNHESSLHQTSERCRVLSLSEFHRHFSSLIWLTYRREFPQLTNSTLTTDCGWGCMLRSGQMMLATALIFHFLKKDWRNSGRCHNREQQFLYKQILRCFSDIECINSPFSIHHLVKLGVQFGKQVGDWYGPSSVAHILRHALDNSGHPMLQSMCIYVAQDCTVYKEDVIRLCTKCISCKKKCKDEVWRSVIILVPVRLGGDRINPIYIPCIKALFSLDYCIGIIGGKPKHSLYFVGYQDEKLINLDPHYCQSMVDMSNSDFSTDSFHCDYPRKLSIRRMDPSCTIGFYCNTRHDFEELCRQTTEVVSPPMQRSIYPMFIFHPGRLTHSTHSLLDSYRELTISGSYNVDSSSTSEHVNEQSVDQHDDYVVL